MKIAKTAFDNFDKKLRDVPVLALIDDDAGKELDDAECTVFKLRTVPTSADSALYSYKVPILDGQATPRQTIKWAERMHKVFTGLNLTTVTQKHNLILEMLTGTVKAAYMAGVNGNRHGRHSALRQQAANAVAARDEAAGETVQQHQARIDAAWNGVAQPDLDMADIENGMHEVITTQCPYKALAKQKRYMRRKMRKPNDLTTRQYVNHLIRINDTELPKLPPFAGDAQKLSADEIVDIICYGIPKSWLRKMDEHNFDPFIANLGDLIAFCERMESSEEHDKSSDTKPSASSRNSKNSKKYKSQRNNGEGKGKWCHFHEVDTHNTNECETLKKLKASKSGGSEGKGAFKNKTWKRKSDDAKSFTKKELSAIAAKASKEAIKKATKKGKAECNHVAKRKSDSDSDSDNESCTSLNMMEASMAEVNKQLANFDFDKSEGEVSC